MREEKEQNEAAVAGGMEGGRRPTGVPPARDAVGPLVPGQRWSVARKREVSLRLLRGESAEALSRALGVEIYRLEQWRDKALSGIDTALKVRAGDPPVGIYERRVLNCKESRTLAALRDTLLPKLISGELRVPEAEEVAVGAA